ncbi:MAG: hypothetical protein LBF86_08615 [Helicobacteraceae bacterium]|jgi:hypothetical protein|nr:hypothetical protein [Helicobacteraceae bacterium]
MTRELWWDIYGYVLAGATIIALSRIIYGHIKDSFDERRKARRSVERGDDLGYYRPFKRKKRKKA